MDLYHVQLPTVKTIFKQENVGFKNGMLRHSLATLEGEWEFVVFYRALLFLWWFPLSLSPSLVSLFFSL